ncbi:MAG: hypothetical protein KBH07_12990 [Flavobacteriales bacterium]|nr:hypothetical protein [Flavobacteriales bacterium]MBP9079710.1 hypothetical protein [Flavobacteriales bacterium]
MQQLLGTEAGDLLKALHAPAPVSIRLNPVKHAGMEAECVPWCGQGRYLGERPVFTLDPLLHAGAYYVQEASSMLVQQAYRACCGLPADPVVLDLCAAPGGKTTHLAALLPERALLIGNEPVRSRIPALSENLWKWGRPNTVITAAAPGQFLPMGAFCDLILVDAPCSGEGMFRKDPQARAQWGANLVRTCAARQQNILDSAWALLKPGGYLIYSTCTWEMAENEGQVERLQGHGADPVPIPVEQDWGVVATPVGLRCYPHRLRGEGFFISLLRKPMPDNRPETAQAAGKDGPDLPPELVPWFREPDDQCAIAHSALLHVVNKRWHQVVHGLGATVPLVAPGIPVALRKGEAWFPHPALALNGLLRHAAFTRLDLDLDHARRYLQGEAIQATGAMGTALVRYNALGLGWAHGAGNRWNNLWHPAWRIRMR